MTFQTIVGYLFFGMAVHAPAHRHVHPWLGGRPLPFGNIPMAGLAWKFAQDHMPAMRKEDMIGLTVNPFPGNFFTFCGKLPNLFLLRTLRNRLLVTLHAGGHRGHSGKNLGFGIRVARITLQALLHVFLVVEGDRLLRSGANAQADEEKEYEEPCRQSDKEEFHRMTCPVSIRLPGGSPGSDRLMIN